uniref:Uncharacterized protein n=1 Tax=Strombidinopsis acuminata TaxID=141414 RepID=A0A7S3TM93_9SPIT|mmetsp:Transcript_27203/g.82574  ORF Transcript_27203/g.82574 Transcript_27203/m.82574 type:complete len:112 (-) Transcript_27203:224-559(-)
MSWSEPFQTLVSKVVRDERDGERRIREAPSSPACYADLRASRRALLPRPLIGVSILTQCAAYCAPTPPFDGSIRRTSASAWAAVSHASCIVIYRVAAAFSLVYCGGQPPDR